MRAIFTLTLAVLAFVSARAQNAIETADHVILRDETRSKDIEFFAVWPKGGDKCPVILFSHGAGGSGSTYAPLIEDWAAHGYAVLAPTHDDSLRRGGDIRSAVNKALTDVDGFIGRVDDVKFLLGHFADVEAKLPALKGRLDAQRVGVGGHSFGSYTAMLLAGARVNLPGRAVGESFADARPVAFLLLSPQGRSPHGDLRGLRDASWKTIARPLLTITGTRDLNTSGEGADWRLETIRLAAPGDRFGVNLAGASHMTFTGQPALGKGFDAPRDEAGREAEARIFAEARTVTRQFWDATLKGNAKAHEELQNRAGLVRPQTAAKPGASLTEVTLVARDAEHSAKFYGDLLGVEMPAAQDAGAGRTVRVLPVGGVGLRIIGSATATLVTPGALADALGYRMLTLLVVNIEATAKRLSDAGWPALTVQKFAPGVRFAMTRDLEGNLVELGSFDAATATQLGSTLPGVMVGLNVSDATRADTFYGQTLGLTAQPTRTSPSGMRHSFTAGSGTIKSWESARSLPQNNHSTEAACGIRAVALAVADLDGAFARLKNAGAKILTPPDGANIVGRSFTITDPDGNTVEIREHSPTQK